MATTTIKITTDTAVRDKAAKVAEEFGISLATLLNQVLEQVGRTKKVNLDLDETPSKWMIQTMQEAEEEVNAGRVSPTFSSAKDAIAWLKDPHATDANGNKVRDQL